MECCHQSFLLRLLLRGTSARGDGGPRFEKPSGLIAIFHEEFVKTGRFDRERARALLRGHQRRQKAD